MNQSSEAFNILSPYKKLTQLIAQAWLNGRNPDINTHWLIEHKILSTEEADFFNVEINTQSGNKLYIDAVTQQFILTYPQQYPDDPETLKQLEEWVKSSHKEAPWIPPEPLPQLEKIVGLI